MVAAEDNQYDAAPWPGRGVVLVILSGNHSSQVSPIIGSRGLAQNVPNESFAVENRVAACRRARGARPLPRGSVSLHVLLRRGDTLIGPLREARECTRGPRSPDSGSANVPCVGGPLCCARPMRVAPGSRWRPRP